MLRRADRVAVGRRDRAVPRDRPRPRGERPDGHPRLALPQRGPRARGHGHDPARRQGRPDRARAAETEDTLVAAMLGRSVGRTYPPKRRAAGGRAGRAAGEGPDGRRASTGRRSRSGPARSSGSPGSSARPDGVRPGDLRRRPAVAAELRPAPRRCPGSRSGRIRAKVAMIPESRKDDGLMLRRPVRENVSLASLRSLGRFGFVRRRPEAERGPRRADRASPATSALETPPAALSGGNQQKLLFARALLAEPARAHRRRPDARRRRRREARPLPAASSTWPRRGVAILLISNEVEEILGLAHRVVVMRGGRVVAELSRRPDDGGSDRGLVLRAGTGGRG